MKDVENIKAGLIAKMNATEFSHVSEPYYVEIISSFFENGVHYIRLYLPGHNMFMFNSSQSNYDYHTGRMEIMGTKKDFGHLLVNQKLVYKSWSQFNKL